MVALVLPLIWASYVTGACASENLVCHGGADAFVPMSVKTVKVLFLFNSQLRKPDFQCHVKSCFSLVHCCLC